MRLSECAALSSASFRVPPDEKRPCLGQPSGPHKFELHDGEHGFVTPAGHFSLLEAERGVVFRTRTTPHLSYVTQEQAIGLADELGRLLQSKGWVADVWVPAPDRKLRLAKAAEDRPLSLRARGLAADVTIRRAVEANSAEGRMLRLSEDAYLVTLLIQGEAAGAPVRGAAEHER